MPKFKKKSSDKFVLPFFKEISLLLAKIGEKFSFLKWFDPFTYVDIFVMPRVKKVTTNEYVEMGVNIFFALIFAFAIYSLLGIIFGTQTPLVIVYSASMENTFFRGDVMALTRANVSDNFGEEVFLTRSIGEVPTIDYVTPNYSLGRLISLTFKDSNGATQEVLLAHNGNVVVYPAFPSGLPIIHRGIVKINANDGVFILTKGDNMSTNPTFDQDCGNITPELNLSQKPCISFYANKVDNLVGKTFFMVPKVGCVKLWLLDDLFSLIQTGALPRDFTGFC
ncbi:MAG: hypothetical protein WCW44_00185 [archaeon]|jgi:signal peptidase I